MIRQLPDWGKRKKSLKRGSRRLPTGPRTVEPTDTRQDDDIEPADFFDPEEFGTRSPDPNSSHP